MLMLLESSLFSMSLLVTVCHIVLHIPKPHSLLVLLPQTLPLLQFIQVTVNAGSSPFLVPPIPMVFWCCLLFCFY